MKLTSKQENAINVYMRDVAAEMERYLGPDERARRLNALQRHVYQSLEALSKPVIDDSDIEAALQAAGMIFAQQPKQTEEQKRFNPEVKLMLTPEDMRWLGVCGGIAARFGLESWMVRLLVVIFALAAPPLVFTAYFCLYCWMYFQADRSRLPRLNPLIPVWRLGYTIAIVYAMNFGAHKIRGFIFFAHHEYLNREVPAIGDWDWIILWNDTLANWVLLFGVPIALLSGTPLLGGWSESLKRIPWAMMALYFVAISFGIASILVGIILDFVEEFTGDPQVIFQIFDQGR